MLAPDGAGGVEFRAEAGGGGLALLPTKLYYTQGYYASGDPHNLTVTAPTTGSLVLIIQSDGRAATSVTQTNVTWTEMFTANNGSLYTSFWVGAITDAAGTTISADYASSTKAELTFIVFDGPELTTLEGSGVESSGHVSLSGVPLGTLCLAAETAFNANSNTYTINSAPHLIIVQGGCLMITSYYYSGPTYTDFIQGATRHDAAVGLS